MKEFSQLIANCHEGYRFKFVYLNRREDLFFHNEFNKLICVGDFCKPRLKLTKMSVKIQGGQDN